MLSYTARPSGGLFVILHTLPPDGIHVLRGGKIDVRRKKMQSEMKGAVALDTQMNVVGIFSTRHIDELLVKICASAPQSSGRLPT